MGLFLPKPSAYEKRREKSSVHTEKYENSRSLRSGAATIQCLYFVPTTKAKMEKISGLDQAAPTPLSKIEDLARISLFAALVGIGAFIHLPFGPLHLTLQTMMVMLTGFILGSKKAALAMSLYLACGFIGFPMFGRGKAGPALFLGPSAGYLAGFMAGAAIAGVSVHFRGNRRRRLAARLFFGLAGTLVLLFFGAAGIRLTLAGDWNRALAIGMYPFLPGDCLKLLAAMAVMELRCGERKSHTAAANQ